MNAPADVDGISFLPALLGQKQKAHDYLYWRYGSKQAVRQGKWKAVRNGKRPVELYDLDADIGEQNDTAARHPEVVDSMEKIMVEAYRPLAKRK